MLKNSSTEKYICPGMICCCPKTKFGILGQDVDMRKLFSKGKYNTSPWQGRQRKKNEEYGVGNTETCRQYRAQ